MHCQRPVLLLSLLGVITLACQSKEPPSTASAPAKQVAAEAQAKTPAPSMVEPTLQAPTAEGEMLAREAVSGAMADVLQDSEKKDEEARPTDAKSKAGEKGEDDKLSDPNKSWQRSTNASNDARLRIGDEASLPLHAVQMRVEVDAFRARVVSDYYYFNDRDQVLEGNFDLRLPNGASPFFLAFGQTVYSKKEDMQWIESSKGDAKVSPESITEARSRSWQEPKIARMVQKEKAAFAYTETVRRRVDPAISEWAGSGIFSTRVYPISPKQLHRITVAYDVDLLWLQDNAELLLDLPEAQSRVVDLSVLEIPNVELSVTPEQQFESINQRRHYHITSNTPAQLRLNLQGLRAAALSGEDTAGSFFAADFLPELESRENSTRSHAVFMLDSSLSSNPDQFNVWLALLRKILDNNRENMKYFAILSFDIEQRWWKQEFVENTPEAVQQAIDDARTLALEGATDLAAALRQANSPAWATAEQQPFDIFLLSDAASTWGESDKNRIVAMSSSPAAVFAYHSGFAQADRSFMQQLCRETGGALFSVVGESELDAASVAHRNRPYLIESIEVTDDSQRPTQDILLAGRATSLFPGQRIRLAGRGALVGELLVTLKVRADDGVQTIPLRMPTFDSPLAARSYGEIAVAQLEEFGEPAKAYAVPFARHFRITGPSASLLMLESEEDYARFELHPEEDQELVARTPVAPLVSSLFAQLSALLGNPRADFFAFLGSLEEMQNPRVALLPKTKALLESLPDSAFSLPPAPLLGTAPQRSALSQALLSALETRQIDYQQITAEAERRLTENSAADALSTLSSLVENRPGDTVLARDIGYQAMQWGLYEQAYHLFSRVARSRPWEPQSYHAMALDLAEAGLDELALAYFEIALAGQWDSRFGAFHQIVSLDYLRFLRTASSGNSEHAEYMKTRLKEMEAQFDFRQADLVVSITWNTDNSDVDLHVIEPSGEECYYAHNVTASGGALTQDVTQGYGPEMYVLRSAPKGRYLIRAKYFASDAGREGARSKVYATIIEHWGHPEERLQRKVITLETGKDMHDLVELKL
ncbi:MAG: hypothetical protein RBU37_05255 [Myxococcota bacterium]|nr:hypothetical protein [Myxococcota bacterium]